MLHSVLPFLMLCVKCSALYNPYNVSRATLAGIAEYRSALTLDLLAAEDFRQKELVLAFHTESTAPMPMVASDCISYVKPASGKVARLMLELLKNLEGDEGTLIPELIQALLHTQLLVETSLLEAEPDLDSLVKTPGIMMGEPHTTFPRILALAWIAATDPTTVKKIGWCPIKRVTKYLLMTRPMHIASHMRDLDPVIARARYVMEDFIQHVTPNIYVRNLEHAKIKSVNEYQATSPSHPPRYRIRPLNELAQKDRYPRLNSVTNTGKFEPLQLPTTALTVDGELLELPMKETSNLDEALNEKINRAGTPGLSVFLLFLIVLRAVTLGIKIYF